MTRLVIVGASGMVGGQALRYALEHPDVDHVTSIGRRKLGISHPKLKEVLDGDFADCPAAHSIMAGSFVLQRRPNTFAQTNLLPHFSLATKRRTIHSG